MGDFSEHVLFGFLSAAVVSYFLKGVVSFGSVDVLAGGFAVFLGSILPDIDHKRSYVHRSVKSFTSLSLGALVAYVLPLSLPQRFISGTLVFLLVYWLIGRAKIRHRGITHSFSFLIIVGSLSVLASNFLLYSVLPGLALGVGVLSHLVLDREFKLD